MNQIASDSWIGTVLQERPGSFRAIEAHKGNGGTRPSFRGFFNGVIVGREGQAAVNLGKK
jgi:hypothetical protein